MVQPRPHVHSSPFEATIQNYFLRDPLYVARLQQSGSAQLVRAWLDGDWGIVEGAFFDKWRVRNIVTAVHECHADWTRDSDRSTGAMPHRFRWVGGRSPATLYPVDGLTIPRGALVRYREWYGSTGRPNEGLKLTAEEVAEGIVSRERDDGVSEAAVADPSIFSSDGGPSLAERMGTDLRPLAARRQCPGRTQRRPRRLGPDAQTHPRETGPHQCCSSSIPAETSYAPCQ